MVKRYRNSIAFFILFIFTIASNGAFAQKGDLKTAPGVIDTVTVYSDRALVTRNLKVDTSAQTGHVVFSDLPVALISDSLRASTKKATISGVSLVPTGKQNSNKFKKHPLKIKIKEIDEKLHRANNKLATYREQLKILSSFARLTTEKSDRQVRGSSIDTSSWAKALSFIGQQRNTYLSQMRKVELEVGELRDERRPLQDRLSRLTRASKTATVVARVSFAKHRGTSLTINLQYMVRRVSWKVFYDLRGSSEESTFSLLAHAVIKQSTGEIWPNAKIILSSAKPSVSTSPGVLSPWRVSASSLGRNRNQSSSADRSKNFADSDRESLGTGGGDAGESSTFSIKLPGRETINSDYSNHEVTLNASELKGKVSHVAVPSLSTSVFLRARLGNSSGMPIFQGNINIFLDRNFVGKARLSSAVAAGEQFEMFLGPDQRMRLKRKLLRGDVEGSGVFSKNVKIVNQWQIEIGNYSGKKRKITIFDQYPVPADPKISTSFEGSNTKVNKDANGILRWQIDLNPQQKRKIDFTYSLSVPSEMFNQFLRRARPKAANEESDFSNRPIRKKGKRRQYNLEQMLK